MQPCLLRGGGFDHFWLWVWGAHAAPASCNCNPGFGFVQRTCGSEVVVDLSAASDSAIMQSVNVMGDCPQRCV
jgi:hypothetical protein